MPTEIKVPNVGDSISEVVLIQWLVAPGQRVERDAIVVELESEKATVEVPAPVSGVLTHTLKQAGETCLIGEVIGQIDPVAAPSAPSSTPAPTSSTLASSTPATSTATPASAASANTATGGQTHVMPAAARVLGENGLPSAGVPGTGPGGRVLKEDAERAVAAGSTAVAATPSAPASSTSVATVPTKVIAAPGTTVRAVVDRSVENRSVRRQAMTPVRRRIAQRLLEAQQTAALLTTFNEVDMTAVQTLRKQQGEAFLQRYGVKLGFMSFFVKAAVEALKEFPAINAQIQGNDIIYHDYFDIGIAIGGGKGLVVPILRNTEAMSFAGIEQAIGEFAKRAQGGTLSPQDLTGGTFTISNGGVYGSMLSTPIVNPPQSGVLGMHSIQDRAMVRDGQIVIRPMMYLALTYDHRIVDGREGVSFLKTIKDVIENPVRLMF